MVLGLSTNHPGNLYYRSLVDKQRPTFRGTRKSIEKREVASNIITSIKDAGGRFLVEDQSGTCIIPSFTDYNKATTNYTVSAHLLSRVWVEVTDEYVITKVMKRLSEKTYQERMSISVKKAKGRKDDGNNIKKNEKKKKGGKIDGENNIKNKETEDIQQQLLFLEGTTTVMTTNANGNLEPKQIRHPTAMGEKDESYERQIQEYYKYCSHAKCVPKEVRGDVLNPSAGKEDEKYERQIQEYNRLHQAHSQKQQHEMEALVCLQKQAQDERDQAHLQKQQNEKEALHQAHLQKQLQLRLRLQKQAQDEMDISPPSSPQPRHQPATPPDAFAEEKAWAISHNLSRAYEQQILEYKRLQNCGGDGTANEHHQLQHDNGRFMTKPTLQQLSHAQEVIAQGNNNPTSNTPAKNDAVVNTTGGRGFRFDYALGDTARVASHMIIETNPERAIDSIGTLVNHDFAWVKRTDGTYTYSILAYRSSSSDGANEAEEGQAEEYMTFVLNNLGVTKIISKSLWGRCIRLVAPENDISAPSSRMKQPPENIKAEVNIQMMHKDEYREFQKFTRQQLYNEIPRSQSIAESSDRLREREKEPKATLTGVKKDGNGYMVMQVPRAQGEAMLRQMSQMGVQPQQLHHLPHNGRKSPEDEEMEASASLILRGLK